MQTDYVEKNLERKDWQRRRTTVENPRKEKLRLLVHGIHAEVLSLRQNETRATTLGKRKYRQRIIRSAPRTEGKKNPSQDKVSFFNSSLAEVGQEWLVDKV